MTTTSVPDIMECGGRVTIEQVLIFVDAPLVVLLVLAFVFTALTSMTSKKASSVPGVCTMFLKMSLPAILRNRRRLRDQVIIIRVTDTNGRSCNWVEFNPRSGTTGLDLPLPTRQSMLSLVEMRITCLDTYHRTSSQYSEWSESAASQLRYLIPLSIKDRHLDYQMVTKSSTISITPSGDAKVMYPLTLRPIKNSTQELVERGGLMWLSLCLAGLLSFSITLYINQAYSEFGAAVVVNVLNIIITTANVIVAVTSAILAFLFVKILATPFRRYNKRQRRGHNRRLCGHTLGHDVSGTNKWVIQTPYIQLTGPERLIAASGDCDATEKLTWANEAKDNKVKLVTPFKSKSLPYLDGSTLKSANPSPSRHSLPTSTSSISVQSCPVFFPVYCKSANIITEESSTLSNRLEVTEDTLPMTSQPKMVTEDTLPMTSQPKMVTEGTLPMTSQPKMVTEGTLPRTSQPKVVTEDTLPRTSQPKVVTEDTLPMTSQPKMVSEEIFEGSPDLSLPRSSESSTSVSSTFTIESLPEELPGGIYRTEKYIYKECSTPWHYNSWIDDPPFQSSVYLDWVNDNNKDNNNKNNNSSNTTTTTTTNNNNNNNFASTIGFDIEENIEVAELSPPRIKITRSHAPLFLVMLAMIGSVIALHIYVVKTSLCQQTLEASVISWALASLVITIIWLMKQMYGLCRGFPNN